MYVYVYAFIHMYIISYIQYSYRTYMDTTYSKRIYVCMYVLMYMYIYVKQGTIHTYINKLSCMNTYKYLYLKLYNKQYAYYSIHIHTCVIAELSSLLPDRDALSGAELFPESTGLLRQGTGCGLGGGGRGVQSPARAHQGRRGDGVTDRHLFSDSICMYIYYMYIFL